MVLDEAQAIKSSSSNRWKTLLSFDCRNRLLLTGTPVQNSMQGAPVSGAARRAGR
jgi:DNA helicase INO80